VELHHREIDQVVATKQPIRGEVSFPHATLGVRFYDYIFVPVFNEKGAVEAVAGTTRDITEIRQAQEVLKQNSEKLETLVAERTRELQRSNKELEEFAYAASHDLKEPIRKIHFFSDRLKERLGSKLEEEDRRYFERLEMGIRRMNSLIDDLLLYSHVSRGKGSDEAVDLNHMLSFVLDDLELHIEEKGAHIEVGPLPTIRGHQRQLQQLFENLLGNALKYNKSGVAPHVTIKAEQVAGAHLTVESSWINRSKNYHLIQVSDNGIGFPQEDAERIFHVFTRLHGNAEYKGTGVGLSIAQKVVQNQGGAIWAESTPGSGATFKLILPVD
jgi:light-regulated signal transduction histidine kinase (bacteriophytochrome)